MTRVYPTDQKDPKKPLKPMYCAACGYKTTTTIVGRMEPCWESFMRDGQMVTPIRMLPMACEEVPMNEGEAEPFIELGLVIQIRGKNPNEPGPLLYACPKCGNVKIELQK